MGLPDYFSRYLQEQQRLLDTLRPELRAIESYQQSMDAMLGKNLLATLAERESETLRALTKGFDQSAAIEQFKDSIASTYIDALNARELFGASSALAHFATEQSAFRKQIEALTLPTIRMLEEHDAILSVAKLSALGNAVGTVAPFDAALTDTLAETLGQWTSRVDFPSLGLSAIERLEVYRDRGLDMDLVRLPAPLFGDVLEAVDLRFPVPSPAPTRLPKRRRAESDDAYGVVAPKENRRAYDVVFFLERNLRAYIHAKMAERYGADWPQHRLDKNTWKRWEKRARAAGTDVPPIEFADLGDYPEIIAAPDHWDEVFAPAFCRRESMTESFYRLEPVRHATMHARVLTREEVLILYVEARRLLQAIGVQTPAPRLQLDEADGSDPE